MKKMQRIIEYKLFEIKNNQKILLDSDFLLLESLRKKDEIERNIKENSEKIFKEIKDLIQNYLMR